VQAHAVVQYAGAAAEVLLAEREGETRPRLTLRRVVEGGADDDRELLAGIAQVWGLLMPADTWHEPAWEAACVFVEERWTQVAAVAEANSDRATTPAKVWRWSSASSARSVPLQESEDRVLRNPGRECSAPHASLDNEGGEGTLSRRTHGNSQSDETSRAQETQRA